MCLLKLIWHVFTSFISKLVLVDSYALGTIQTVYPVQAVRWLPIVLSYHSTCPTACGDTELGLNSSVTIPPG